MFPLGIEDTVKLDFAFAALALAAGGAFLANANVIVASRKGRSRSNKESRDQENLHFIQIVWRRGYQKR